MFCIHSVSSDREIVFSAHKGDYFHVALKDKNISFSVEVWATNDRNGLNNFFQELASLRVPWSGTRSWTSLEGEFNISATCTMLGHIVFTVKLNGQPGETEAWKVQAGLETELGQLEKIAQSANSFFQG